MVIGSSLLLKRTLTGLAQFFVIALVLGFGFVAYIFLIEPNWVEVHRVTVRDPALAKALSGLKIAQISDLHLRKGIGWRERNVAKKISALRPDLLFVTGDWIDDLNQLGPLKGWLKHFSVRMGIWGVPGNTDYLVLDGVSLQRELAPLGVHVLVNQAERIQTSPGKFLWLAGTDDPVERHANLSKAIGQVPPGSPVVLLAHSPDIFEEAVRDRVNLVLVGHTHGGQVGIPLFIRMSEYANRSPYIRGLFKKGGTQMYVNRGLGMKTLPVRFLCRPEITVFEVRR